MRQYKWWQWTISIVLSSVVMIGGIVLLERLGYRGNLATNQSPAIVTVPAPYGPPGQNPQAVVTYRVTTDSGRVANIVYGWQPPTGVERPRTLTDKATPWADSMAVPDRDLFAVIMVATNSDTEGQIVCDLLISNQQVDRQVAWGRWAQVTCRASVAIKV